MKFERKHYSNAVLTDLYKGLVLPRLVEEKMLILLRQGKVSKWFSGIGQEAIAVGITKALQHDEYLLPMHRNLGVFTTRNVPLERLCAQWQGTQRGYTNGRDRSFHFGSQEHRIIGMISHLGSQNGVATGIALATLLKKEKKITVVFNGDGGISEGDFHEAINVAAVWNLPIIFVVENNGYALSTPGTEQFRCKHVADKAPGYGIAGIRVDGNNILEVYDTVTSWAARMREQPCPLLLEAVTFRLRGHEEASGTKYVPRELIQQWSKKDPVTCYENFLLQENIISSHDVNTIRKAIAKQIDESLTRAFTDRPPVIDTQKELSDIYLPFQQKTIEPRGEKRSEKRFVDAISDGLRQSMKKYPNLILMGQDIAEYGGVFKVTNGLATLFGKERVRNTPLCESAIVGAGLGLSIQGLKSMIEMQFADFITEGFNQVINNLAKSHWRWGQNADVVIRMPTGAGVGAGPFHSQSNEAWFFHTPGIKIVYPSNPYDAKGLLNAAIEDPNPYLFFEHKKLYRSLRGEVPDEYYTVSTGQAHIVHKGDKLSVITYGMGVHWTKALLKEMPEAGIEIIDLRTLMPWDKETIRISIKKTSRALVLHEDTLTGGIGAEIAAWISEYCFTYLDAPVVRLASLDTPVPYASVLEENFLPQTRLKGKIEDLLRF